MFCILLCFAFQQSSVAQDDTLYFDINWKEIEKEKAVYYRLYPKVGENYQISDYYMSGKIQFSGQANSSRKDLESISIAKRQL